MMKLCLIMLLMTATSMQAFKEQYGIDLNDANLHWWKFRALFMSLRADCMFTKILGYRTMPITSKMSTADRNFYQRMKKLYALPLPAVGAGKV